MEVLQLIATSAGGLEACVKRELTDLGFDDAKTVSPGRVTFTANAEGLARANLWLRTADRVLLVVGRFPADDFDALFEQTRALPWEQWIPADGAFPVNGRSVKSTLSSVPACQRTAKKAIVEKLLAAHGTDELPETGATFTVEVGLLENQALLTLDTTGPGLNKRGYRAAAGPAPIKETLAAAMVQLSFWNPDRPLVDPFCGSGTIAIEAALIGRKIAPGLNRTFAAERWPAILADVWQQQRQKARDVVLPELPERIIATDIEPDAVSLATHHAHLAGVAADIHFQAKAFEDFSSNRQYGCVICNPPYGERFKTGRDVMALYRAMPEVFRQLKTWSFYVITSVDLEEILGQRADRRRKLYNGQIECTYYQFHGPRPPRAGGPWQESPAPAFGGLKDNAPHQVEVFTNRLRKMARHLRRWPGRGITCYRLYDRDVPEVPLAIDLYEGRLLIVEYDRPHDRSAAQHADWLEMLAEAAGKTLDIDRANIVLKRRAHTLDDAIPHIVHEGPLAFEVDLAATPDTGLDLDHRILREKLRDESKGRRVLVLAAGTFSVCAAAGGAIATTTVSEHQEGADRTGRNLTANNHSGPQHHLVRAEAMGFLRDHAPGEHYDLAVIDAPAISGAFDLQRDYAEMLTATAALMPSGGTIYFITTDRRFKLDPEALSALSVREISRQTVPEDFRNKRIHRCWRLTKYDGQPVEQVR